MKTAYALACELATEFKASRPCVIGDAQPRSVEIIEAALLDAFKAGMTRAANLLTWDIYNDGADPVFHSRQIILCECHNLTKLP